MFWSILLCFQMWTVFSTISWWGLLWSECFGHFGFKLPLVDLWLKKTAVVRIDQKLKNVWNIVLPALGCLLLLLFCLDLVTIELTELQNYGTSFCLKLWDYLIDCWIYSTLNVNNLSFALKNWRILWLLCRFCLFFL